MPLSRKFLLMFAVMALLPALLLWGAAKLYRISLIAAANPAQTKMPQGAQVEDTHLRGWIVFARANGIWWQRIGSKQAKPLTPQGSYPRISPDGRRIAFVRGKAIAVMNSDGSGLHELAPAADPRAVGWSPDGQRVLFSDGQKIRQIALSGGPAENVAMGYTFRELDMAPDGRSLVTTIRSAFGVKLLLFDLTQPGKGHELADGCSGSFSPDGRLVTVLDGRHLRLTLLDPKSAERRGGIDAPPDLRFDNQFWSNHPDWIVSMGEGDGGNVYMHQVSTNRSFRVTQGGGCERPDLFVEGP